MEPKGTNKYTASLKPTMTEVVLEIINKEGSSTGGPYISL